MDYNCAVCRQPFSYTFRFPWDAHCCAACGDHIASSLGEARGNPGQPMGIKAGSTREAAGQYLARLGWKPPRAETEATDLIFCTHGHCGCTYLGSCREHGKDFASKPGWMK